MEIRFHNNDTQESETRCVTHLQYVTWPDLGIPEECDYPILDEILSAISAQETEKPLTRTVVHCTAGVGRTGSLICLYNACQTINYYLSSP